MSAGYAAIAQGTGSGVGSALSGYGAWRGAKSAQNQINKGITEQGQMADAERARQAGYQQPWMEGGQQAFSDLQQFRMREANPYSAQTFGGVDMSQDPGVQFRMDQANKGLDASASSKGALFSGAQRKALAELNQNLASQEYGNAHTRQYGQFRDEETARRDQYNTEADRTMNYDQYRMGQLQNMANMGQTATGQLSNSSGNIYGTQAGNMMTLRGAAADASAMRSAAPWQAAGGMFGGAGKAAGNYFMSK